MALEIFKIQRPLATSDPRVPWLIYNEDRSIYFEVPKDVIDEKLKKFMNNGWKVYVWGEVIDGQLKIDKFIEDLGW